MSLNRWGWNSYFESLWRGTERGTAVPARVIAQERVFWRVAGKFGECTAEAAGKLRLCASAGVEWPAAGDWVAVVPRDANTAATIQGVLPRRTCFVRKSPGKKMEEQVLAANVDTAFLVSALDGDFNPRRVERYLAQCRESGAMPVILLNKADKCGDLPRKTAEIERIAGGAAICVASAKTGQGIEELEKFLVRGHTLVLLGSSGAGKSTLANRLLGQTVQEVQPVREGDSRGRHTTSRRELFVLPGGALLMDTPGLRELQLWEAEDGVAQAFRDLDSMAAVCRFGDCQHRAEPGCAVQAALREGSLDEGRLENYRKLLREQEFLRRKMDPGARHEEKDRIKKLTREVRRISRHKIRDSEK